MYNMINTWLDFDYGAERKGGEKCSFVKCISVYVNP